MKEKGMEVARRDFIAPELPHRCLKLEPMHRQGRDGEMPLKT